MSCHCLRGKVKISQRPFARLYHLRRQQCSPLDVDQPCNALIGVSNQPYQYAGISISVSMPTDNCLSCSRCKAARQQLLAAGSDFYRPGAQPIRSCLRCARKSASVVPTSSMSSGVLISPGLCNEHCVTPWRRHLLFPVVGLTLTAQLFLQQLKWPFSQAARGDPI